MGRTSTRSVENGLTAERMQALYATPGDEREILDAWEKYVSGIASAGSPVRLVVQSSWQRSVRNGVDAHNASTPLVVDENSLNELRKSNRLLRACARSTMDENAQLLQGTGSILILTDAHGVVLEVTGESKTIDSAREINLFLGGNWSEAVVGTNGIGTAIATGMAVQVHAAEHFCAGIKQWTCAAAPIHDSRDGRLMGVLDISGPNMTFCQHNLALALAASRQIETLLAHRLLDDKSRLLAACLSSTGHGKEAMVVLDQAGSVIYVNEDASVGLDSGSIHRAMRLGSRIAEPGSTPTVKELAERLPPGLRPEWLHPVVSHGEMLGAILVIPDSKQDIYLPRETIAASEKQPKPDAFDAIIGSSKTMGVTKSQARRLAMSTAPILIQGETGVGKELFAHAIQAAGNLAIEPMVTYNCGAVPRELIGSELFGYVRGAFTGASNEGRAGRFEQADGGTLCLDEIGEMPLDLQPYLLRVLDEGVVYRLGENKPRKINVRLLASTNRSLMTEIEAGRFRQDLYYRISVTTLNIPPLRERGTDVEQLIRYFNTRLAKQYGVGPARFSTELMDRLLEHGWPGNVRELRNMVESLLMLGSAEPVSIDGLPAELHERLCARSGTGVYPMVPSEPALNGLKETERDAVLKAINHCRGNMSRTARLLGISRSTLYRKMGHYGISSAERAQD